jgi:hypothetical protein
MVEVMRAEGWMVVVYNRRGHVVLDGDHISTEKTVQAGFSELEVELRSLSGGQLPPVSGVSGHSSSSKDYLSARSEMSPQNEGTVSGGPVEGVVVPDEADSERYHPATPGSDGPFSAEPPIAQGIVRVWPLYSDVEDMKEVRIPKFHFSKSQPRQARRTRINPLLYILDNSCQERIISSNL